MSVLRVIELWVVTLSSSVSVLRVTETWVIINFIVCVGFEGDRILWVVTLTSVSGFEVDRHVGYN